MNEQGAAMAVQDQRLTNALTAADIRAQVNLIQQVMREVMQGPSRENPNGVHYGIVPGCGKKMVLFKPGAEKLSMTFRLRPVIDNDRDISIAELPNGHREIRVYCHILNASGLELATGIGSCSTAESKYRYRGGEKIPTDNPVPKEYWNLKKDGKGAEAQELIGGRGFGVAKIEGEWKICEIGEKMENPDIADVYNTVLKIAKKRAYIDGILSATGASDIFTQDIGDPEDTTLDNPAGPKSDIKPPQSKSGATEAPQPDAGLISDSQRKRLFALSRAANVSEEDLKKHLKEIYQLDHTTQIRKAFYEAICQWVQSGGQNLSDADENQAPK